jgi:hypothetical protein
VIALRVASVLALMLLASADAGANEAGATNQPSPSPRFVEAGATNQPSPSPPPGGGEGRGEGALRPRAGRSDAERRASLDADVARVRDVAGLLARRMERARAARDALELSCLEEKVQRARALLRAAKGAAASARANAGDDLALLEVELARSRADAVRADAEACLGEHAFAADGKPRAALDRAEDVAAAAELAPAPARAERRP